MATAKFSIPDDLKQAFNEAFEGQNVTEKAIRKARETGRP